MTDDAPSRARPARPPPMFNAPLIVVVMAAALVGLHALVAFQPWPEQQSIMFDYALAPERFWAPAGSPRVYPDHVSGLLTLVSSALLHADWLHVLVNAGMLLAFGAPVARTLGRDAAGWGYWMVLFVGSVAGGSSLYLALSDVNSYPMVGASGGVSGLVAAAVLLDGWGMKRSLLSREFLTFTAYFALANLLLVLAGPYLVGMLISWEAHAGGYIAGALLMAILPVRGYREAAP